MHAEHLCQLSVSLHVQGSYDDQSRANCCALSARVLTPSIERVSRQAFWRFDENLDLSSHCSTWYCTGSFLRSADRFSVHHDKTFFEKVPRFALTFFNLRAHRGSRSKLASCPCILRVLEAASCSVQGDCDSFCGRCMFCGQYHFQSLCRNMKPQQVFLPPGLQHGKLVPQDIQ